MLLENCLYPLRSEGKKIEYTELFDKAILNC